MTQTLTPGRWRGLKLTSGTSNVFTILAFDQRDSYTKMLPTQASYDDAVSIKHEVVTALAPNASAVLLDATFGMKSALNLNRSSGLLMALEKSGYTGDSTYRRVEFYDDWTVAKIKRMGASAVKLLIYYHPGAGALAQEIEDLVRRVRAECTKYDIPLFLEPVSYSLDKNVSKSSAEFAATRPQVVRETAERLSPLKPDVLKLEFPVDTEFNDDQKSWRTACEAISKVCDVPWALLSAGVDFEVFEPQIKIACESGASGFLAGRAIWKECIAMSPEDRKQFLAQKAVDRFRRLADIANQHARPWTDFYQPSIGGETWYSEYAE
jgi:tagatose 1,6-diphosphate aldolase